MKTTFVTMIYLLLVAGAPAICLAQDGPGVAPAQTIAADNLAEGTPGLRLGQIRGVGLLPPIAAQKLSARLFPPIPAGAPTAASNEPQASQNRSPTGRTNAARGGGKGRAAAMLVGLGMFAAGLYLTLTRCSNQEVTTGGVTTTTKECQQWKKYAGPGLMAAGGLVTRLGR